MKKVAVFFILVSVFSHASFAFGEETAAERKKRLETELQQVEKQIIQQQGLLNGKQQERQTLERDLNILDTKISKAQLGIQARAMAIEQLSDQIGEKATVIEILNERLYKQKISIAELLRKTREAEDFSLVELMLSKESLSDFFTDFESFRSINESLNESVKVLADIKTDTEEQRNSLEEKKLTEAELKQLQEDEKLAIQQRENEKAKILTVTKGEEKNYKQLLEAQQKTASQLRSELFELAGGGGKIPFPAAVQYAKAASSQTGVPAALILAILEQESSYGANIGSCAYDDIIHGKPVMHPDRDQPVFIALASALGFDPRSQQVSCPWIRSGERIGWGGAMGPSQFIPSTWAVYGGLVSTGSGYTYSQSSDAIRQLTGKGSASSPFNNQDAFMATALLMRDNGAAGGSYNAEWTAAIRYFAGWAGASNPINHPYGDNVMTRKARLQNEIKTLDGG